MTRFPIRWTGWASHPARGAWIEIKYGVYGQIGAESHPARGAWIEMALTTQTTTFTVVAPRKGCVD